MTYIEQYQNARDYYDRCYIGSLPSDQPMGHLFGLADNYVEMYLLEEKMLEALEGLS